MPDGVSRNSSLGDGKRNLLPFGEKTSQSGREEEKSRVETQDMSIKSCVLLEHRHIVKRMVVPLTHPFGSAVFSRYRCYRDLRHR